MTLEIIECEQGSDAWYQARLGIPTASEFATVLAKGRGDSESKTRRTYMAKLAGERLTGDPAENYTNAHFDRGHAMEPEAREMYAFAEGVEPQLVGFIRNGDAGASPDALIGDVGALEIKSALPHILIGHLLSGEFPAEHKAQTQGVLWVAEREWIDLAIYWPKMPFYTRRAYRDEAYIKTLAEAVDRFNDELAAMVDRVRRYGAEGDLRRQLEASAA